MRAGDAHLFGRHVLCNAQSRASLYASLVALSGLCELGRHARVWDACTSGHGMYLFGEARAPRCTFLSAQTLASRRVPSP